MWVREGVSIRGPRGLLTWVLVPELPLSTFGPYFFLRLYTSDYRSVHPGPMTCDRTLLSIGPRRGCT